MGRHAAESGGSGAAGADDDGHSEGYSSWASSEKDRGSYASEETNSGGLHTEGDIESERGRRDRRIRMGGRQLLKLRALLKII